MYVLLLVLTLSMASAEEYCTEDHFFNLETSLCQKCSKCSEGQLLRRTCSKTNDTLCGLENFSFPEVLGRSIEKPDREITPSVLSDEDEKYWKDLAIALIATLSMLVVVTTIIVLITCYRFRNSGWFCMKHVTQDQEDLESGYVVIHKFIPDSTTVSAGSQVSGGSSVHSSPETQPFVAGQQHQRTSRYKPYRPKRRLMNEYVDDVFESDDSSGSRTLRLPLATIPERSEGS